MSRSIRVLGIDPSFTNLGMASGLLDLDGLVLNAENLELIKTAPSRIKTQRKNSDDLDRSRTLFRGLANKVAKAEIAFIEVPVGSQSADAMKSYGICLGLIASIQIPVIPLTPSEVKIAAVNDKNATKREMIQWAYEQYPDLNWLWENKGGKRRLIDANEHLADAIGAINAGLANPEFKTLLAMMRSLSAA